MSEETSEAEAGAGWIADAHPLLEDLHSPPSNEVPATVAFDAELLSTDGYALLCSGLHVYSTGFRIRLELRARDRQRGGGLFDVFHRNGPDGVLIGVEFADGRRGRNVGWGGVGSREAIGDVSVFCRGGGGGERAVDADFYVAPLPPPGPARVICAWPARDVGDTVTALPVEEIAAAVGRVRQLWPRQPRVDETLPEAEPPPVSGDSWFAG